MFSHEINVALVKQKYEQVISQEQTLSLDAIATSVSITYANKPDYKIHQLDLNFLNFDPDIYKFRLKNSEDEQLEVFVDAYTGKVLGDRLRDNTLFPKVYELHYALLAGNIGVIVVGIAALLLFFLTVTGLILWNGWRNLLFVGLSPTIFLSQV